MNVLGLVMFSVVLGATIGKMRERGKPIQDFLVSLSEAMMIITRWVIWWVILYFRQQFQFFIKISSQVIASRCLLSDFCKDFGNGIACTSHWTTWKILCNCPLGTFHSWIRDNCCYLFPGCAQTSLRLHFQNVTSFGNSFRNWFQLRYHANHDQLSR